MVLPAIPGDVLLHLFHPLAGVVRVSPGETRWVWPLHSPVSRLVRVVDAEGHPREHALVRFGKTSVPLATTGRGGLATVTLPAGDWHLEVLDTSGERGAWSGSVESASEEVLEIRLGGTVVFRGNAQDARGQALPGVVVWLAEEPAIATSSDALGRFRLSVPRAPAGMTLCLASPWQSQRTVPLRFSSDSETDLGNVVLEGAPRQEGEERGGLRGQLMDEAGSLLAGAVVEAYPAAQNLAVAQRLAGRPRSSPPRAVANASGIFELAGIEEPGELLVVVVAPGLAPALLAPVELFHEHDVADLGVVTVAAGRTLSGRVRESDGTPVAGARAQVSVELTAGSRAESLIAGARAESAAEGEFELTGLPTGVDLRLRAHKEGFEPVEEVVGARERGSGLDLVFARGYRVRGTVTDPAGTPIEGATVAPEIAPSDASTPPALFAERTAADGWFELASLPCATRAVRVAAPGRFAHSEPLPAVPCGAEIELHLVLEPGSRLAGSVRSEEGAPLAGASVLLRGRSSRSRDDGSFEVDLPLPGPNPVRVQHPGCEPLETVVVAVPGEVVPAAFALRCPASR